MAILKFSGGCPKSANLVIFITLLLQRTSAIPTGHDESSSRELTDSSWILLGFLSICSLVTLISVLIACGGSQGCWGNFKLPKIHWFGRTRREGPISFENPVVELGNALPLSQIDVRALELDPVVFEPLPTIHDLSPLSQQFHPNAGENGTDGRSSYPYPHHQNVVINTNPSIVIPFATEDSELYAHDWFDEPYRNFSRDNLEYIKEVGRGWFGPVLEAQAKDIVPFANKINVLVKKLREDASQIDQMRFLDESRLYRDANQGNILKLLGHSIEQLPFLLIMEQCPQGDLKSYLISNVTRAEMLSSQGILIQMALDIAKGLEWMTTNGFNHHDLATRNCQVASEGRIVIGDYGLATKKFRDDYYWNSNVPIPLRWAAPETLHCTPSTIQTLKVTKQSNIWSFAVLVWEIMEFGKLPYFELGDEEVITRVLAEKNYFLGSPTLPYIPLKDEIYAIMRSCWSINPQTRPMISVVVSKLQSLVSSRGSRGNSLGGQTDDFETKWEQHGRRSTSSGSAGAVFEDQEKLDKSSSSGIRHKKSVSFTGVAQTLESSREEEESEKGRDAFIGKEDSAISQQEVEKRIENAEDDQDVWESGVERGDIAQKVMEKSLSVQNFMVLTHVEPSDMGDPDSLVYVPGGNFSGYEASRSISESSQSTSSNPLFQTTHVSETMSDVDLTETESQLQEDGPNSNKKDKILPSSNTDCNFSGYEASRSISESMQSTSSNPLFQTTHVSETMSDVDASNQESNLSQRTHVSETSPSEMISSDEKDPTETESQLQEDGPNSNAKDKILPSSNKREIFTFGSTATGLSVPNISILPATPGTTPNLTNIDIHVTTATPASNGNSSPSNNNGDAPGSVKLEKDSGNVSGSEKLTLNGKDNSNSTTPSGRRHTSTPKRSGVSGSSPLPPLHQNGNGNDSNGSISDVFEEDEVNDLSLSPILAMKKERAGIQPGETITSILSVGPSDDFGLGTFQGVTSEIHNNSGMLFNSSLDNGDSSDGEDNDTFASPATSTRAKLEKKFEAKYLCATNQSEYDSQLHSPFGDDLTVLQGNIRNGEALSITPRPRGPKTAGVSRVLFQDSQLDLNESVDATDNSNTMSNTRVEAEVDRNHTLQEGNSSGINSSWDVVNSTATSSDKKSNSWDVVSSVEYKDPTESSLSSAYEALPENRENEVAADEFWAAQMQSLSTAAKHTRNLFELSLGEDGDRFVEDIEAANEECGSLVLHDFESSGGDLQTVPVTGGGNSPPCEAKLAFVAASEGEDKEKSQDESFATSTSVTAWEHNNSIDVQKAKTKLAPLHFTNRCATTTRNNEKEDEEEDLDGDEQAGSSDQSIEFVPSTWNQSLTPARPAIKSPSDPNLLAQQQGSSNKSSLKKSVSFERKKKQICYVYEPPPPASDSEEEPSFLARARSNNQGKGDTLPMSVSLDWELTQEELEFAPINTEDSDEEVTIKSNPMDMYRISGFEDTSFHVSASNEPFQINQPAPFLPPQPSTLGELRHTRDKLKLDLCKGEASLLDEDPASKTTPAKLLDSGVGSSANVSPFINNCDTNTLSPSHKNEESKP